MSEQPPCDLIRGYGELATVVPFSRTQLWRQIRAGKFPAPIELGPNSLAWPRDEVKTWLANRPRRVPSPKAEAA